jgi:hypothetical protein
MKTIEIVDTHKDSRGYRVDYTDQTGWGHTTHISTEDLVEHIISTELNRYEFANVEMTDMEEGWHDPESMLMDDPNYCIKSYLEEVYSC